VTPEGHTSFGTLYAFAHRVYAAFLKDGIDPAKLLPHEIENLIRGSLIVQVRDNLASLMEMLRSTPEPMIFSREVKRQAFAEGKALMSEKSVDRYLDLVEGFDTGFSIDDSPMWRAHQSMFRAVGQLPINEAVVSRRRAYWEKKLEESMKKVLSDEQVQSVANLGLDRLVELYLERMFLVASNPLLLHPEPTHTTYILEQAISSISNCRPPEMAPVRNHTLKPNSLPLQLTQHAL